MTVEEFSKTTWRYDNHMSMANYHSTLYKCNEIPNLLCVQKVYYKNGKPTSRIIITYLYNGVVFDSKEELLGAITDTIGNTTTKK